jgi:hypothetical protein
MVLGEQATALNPLQTPMRDRPTELAEWIDQTALRPESVGDIVQRLTALTLPADSWSPGDLVNPFQGDLEDQLWPWNRAANRLVNQGYPNAAADVWSAMYLACLSLQQRLHSRIHKATPLCNIGFALARAGQRRLAAKSWLLGVVEEALSDPSVVFERPKPRSV